MHEIDLHRKVLELTALVQRCQEEIFSLKAENHQLKQEIFSLRAENKRLREENKQLKEKVAVLEEKLGLNSRNSSLPPSRDLYRQRRADRPKSDRRAGGQPGHQGHRREPMVPHEVVSCELEETRCTCGGTIEAIGYATHQVVDIPPIQPMVTEYRLAKGQCARCRKKKIASLPKGVEPDILGPQAKSIITALTGFLGVSKRDAQSCLKTMFGLPVSLGLISRTEARMAKKCQGHYEALHTQVLNSAAVHMDETGHRDKDGKRGWMWVAATREATVLKIAPSRGQAVVKNFLPEYEGFVTSDRYAAYNVFSREQRQICWAHLARDFERMAHSRLSAVRDLGGALVQLTGEVFALDKARRQQVIPNEVAGRRFRKVRKRFLYYLKQAICQDESTQAARVAKNILKSEEMMWRFVKHLDLLEPTNNLAERQLRKYVIYRKRSFFTWSERGNRFLERILSLFLSCRQQQLNPFQLLSQIAAS